MLTMLGVSDTMAQKIYKVELDASMFKAWDSPYPGASVVANPEPIPNEEIWFEKMYNFNTDLDGGGVPYGNYNVYYLWYADLTGTQTITIKGTPGIQLRLLMNRQEPYEGGDPHGGDYVERTVTIGSSGVVIVDVSDLEYVHLNAIKLGYNSPSGMVTSITLDGTATSIISVISNGDAEGDNLENFLYSYEVPNNFGSFDDLEIIEGEGINGSRCFKMTSNDSPIETWSSQFYIKANEVMPNGAKWKLKMAVKADREAMLSTSAHGQPQTWKGGFLNEVITVSTEWREYIWTGEIGVDDFQTIAFDLNNEQWSPGNTGVNFYFDNIEFGYVLSAEEEPLIEEFALESANPENGSFNLPGNLKEFVLTFNQKVDVSSVIASLGNENLIVAGNANSIILTRSGNTPLSGIKTLVVSNVISENGDELDPIVLKYSFGANSGDAQMELIFSDNFGANGKSNYVPDGWIVNSDSEERMAGDYGSGCRVIVGGGNGYGFTDAILYMCSRGCSADDGYHGHVYYGLLDNYKLYLTARKYTLSFDAARWDATGTGRMLEVQVCDEYGNVIAEDIQEVVPDYKSSTDATHFELPFVVENEGCYVLKFFPLGMNGEPNGFGDASAIGNIKLAFIPDVLGIVESQQLAEALEAATETYNELTMEEYEGRYEGEDLTALKNLIEEVNTNMVNYTAPSVFVAKAEELAAATKAANDYKTAFDTYDSNIKRAVDIVADNAENKFSKTDTYLLLKATVERYHASKTVENLGDEEDPIWNTTYTFDVLKDNAELKAANEDLTNAVNVASSLFTEVALGADIQQGNCGIAVLVERNRLGARTLLNMGVDESDPLIEAVKNSVTDDDALASNIKTRITKELYSKLKDAYNDVFGPEVDEYGDPVYDGDEIVTKSYDMTAFIKNPNIYAVDGTKGLSEENVPGWTYPTNQKPGLFTTWGNGRNIEGLPEDGAFTTWWGTCRMEQTITDLPAGIYVVSLCGSDWSNQAGNYDNPHDVNGFVYCKTSDTPAVEWEWGEEEDREYHFAATRTIVYGGQWNMDHPINLGYEELIDEETGFVSPEDGELLGIPVTDGKLTFGIHFAGDAQYFFQHVKLTLVAPADGFDYAKAYSEMQGAVDGKLGDVNHDDEIDVTDVVLIIDDILVKNPANYDASLADVNNDNYIDVTDVVMVIDAILGKIELSRGAEPIDRSAYTAFQMDLTIPAGYVLESISLTDIAKNSHSLAYAMMLDGRCRVVVCSMNNEALPGAWDEVISLNLRGKGDAQVNIDRAVFVTIDGERHELMMNPTSIAELSTLNSQTSTRYDLQGRRVEKNAKGILLEDGRKVVIK